MELTFRITQYNSDALENEVAAALEKQLELYSRKRLPAMWRFIDRNNSRRASEVIIKQRTIRRKIYGIFLTVMGTFLLVPGLIDPRELLAPLIAGIISVVTGVGCIIWPWRKRTNRKFHKIAEELLAGMRKLVETTETPLLVHFTAEGMSLPNNSMIAYQDFQTILRSKVSIFLFGWGRLRSYKKRIWQWKGRKPF